MLALHRWGGLRAAIKIADAHQGADHADKYKEICCVEKGEGGAVDNCCWCVDIGNCAPPHRLLITIIK